MAEAIVAVLTSEVRLQSLLETALATGNLIAFRGAKLANPPTPRGGTWAVDVYGIDSVILYDSAIAESCTGAYREKPGSG